MMVNLKLGCSMLVLFTFQAVCVCVNLDKLVCVLIQEYEVCSESSIFQSWQFEMLKSSLVDQVLRLRYLLCGSALYE